MFYFWKYSLFFALVIILMTNFTFGTYFEHYETLLNALFIGEFCGPIDFSFFVPSWFLLTPLISKVNFFFQTTHSYSLLFTVLNTYLLTNIFFLWSILYNNQLLSKKWFLSFSAISLLLFLDAIIYVNNLKISLYCIFIGYGLLTQLEKVKVGKPFLLNIFLLFVIGMLSRLEIAFLSSMIVFIFSLVFFKRKISYYTFALLFTSLSVFLFYKYYETTFFQEHAIILQTEQEIYDKDILLYDNIINGFDSLKLEAIEKFVFDDDLLPIEEYSTFNNKISAKEYISSPLFLNIYFKKLNYLFYDLKPYVVLLIASFTILLFCFSQFSSNSLKIKSIFFSFFIFVVCPSIITIYRSVPYNFIVSLAVIQILICLMILAVNLNKCSKIFLGIWGLIVVFHSLSHFNKLWHYEIERKEKSIDLRNVLEKLDENDSQIVFLNGIHYDYYPSRLFSSINKKKLNYYYFDFMLSRFNFFKKHNEILFGNGYNCVVKKIDALQNSKVKVIATKSNVVFLEKYSEKFYNLKVKFKVIEPIQESSLDLFVWEMQKN